MTRFGVSVLTTAIVSSLCTYAMVGGKSGAASTLAAPPSEPAKAATGPISIDERDLHWYPVNAYRIHTTAEEVVIDMGFNMLDPNANDGQTMLFHVTDRNVMSYSTAKRLRDSLSRLIDKYEDAYGPIKIQSLPPPSK